MTDERVLALNDFAKGFFAYLGCQVAQEGGRMTVKLSEGAKASLGLVEDELALRFSQKDSADDSVPSVPFVLGGKLFENAVRKMRQDGFYTEVDVPAAHQARSVAELITKWSPQVVWAEVEPLESQPDRVRYYLFNFRVTFRSDAREDVIHTIVSDGAGRSFPELGTQFMELIRARQATAHVATTAADAVMLGIRAASYRAEKDVTFWADKRGMEIEEEVLPRLHKVVGELTKHYNARIEEGAADKADYQSADELRAELRQKIADEVLRHSLTVSIELVNFAVVHGPAVRFGFRLRRGDAVTQLRNWHDLTRDAVNDAYCAVCADREPEKALEARAFTVCDGGHLSCERCTVRCSDQKCTRTLCERHGGLTCQACPTPHATCGIHGIKCDCGRKMCLARTKACDICRSPRCTSCLATCADCKKTLCPSDFAICYCCDAVKCHSHMLSCKYLHMICGKHMRTVNGEGVCERCVSAPPRVSAGQVGAVAGQQTLEEIADAVVPSALTGASAGGRRGRAKPN